MKLYSKNKVSSISVNFLFFTCNKKGFTFLEVIAASAVITIISYLIVTQIIVLQQKISKFTLLPQQSYIINNSISDALPFDENFKKGKLASYTTDNYNWQLRREIEKIYQDKKKEYFLEYYILTIETTLPDSTISNEVFYLKTIEDEKEIEEENK